MASIRFYCKWTVLLSFIVITASGCQNTPGTALNLDIAIESARDFPPVALSVIDHRAQNHLVRLHKGSQPAEFATTSQPLASLISQELRSSINTSNESIQSFDVSIDKALCTVQQSLSSHTAVCEVVIIASSEDPRGELTKTFSRRRTREGSLQVNFDDLNNDLSDLFSSTLNSAIQDSGVQQWLNSYTQSETQE